MQKIKLQLIFPTLLLCVLAAAAGCITGALTAGFGRVLLWIGTFRTEHLISCVPFLPIAGVCMVWIYQKYGRESSQGMSLIFDAADGTAKRIPLRLIPLLIGSTWLTHLCGGSAGREGVAVQLGAAVSHNIGSRIPWFRSIPDAVPILTIAGMAAGFSGLFHAPLAAVCFALEVLAIGKLEYRALLPAAIAAVTANGISVALGLETFQVALPEAGFAPLSVPVLLLGISSGIVGGIFTLLLKQGKIYAAKLLPNPVIRIALCGSVLAMFLLLSGHGRYAGLGTDRIRQKGEERFAQIRLVTVENVSHLAGVQSILELHNAEQSQREQKCPQIAVFTGHADDTADADHQTGQHTVRQKGQPLIFLLLFHFLFPTLSIL